MNQARNTTHSCVEIHDHQVRFVSQIVDFCPVQRYGSSHLNIGRSDVSFDRSCALIISSVQDDELFGLVKVRNIALLVNPAREVSCTCTISSSARYDSKYELARIDGCNPDRAD